MENLLFQNVIQSHSVIYNGNTNTKRNTNLEAYKHRKYSANSDHHFCAFGKNMTQVTGF